MSCSDRGVGDLCELLHVLERENVIDLENNDELTLDLGHAMDEICPQVGAEGRRGFDIGGRNVEYGIDRIDHHADILALALGIDLDDDDTSAFGGVTGGSSESRREID